MVDRLLATVLILAAVGGAFAAAAWAFSPTSARIRLAVSEEGRPTPLWIEAIRNRNSDEEISVIEATRRPLTAPETEWLALFEEQVPKWAEAVPGLTIPFENVPAPKTTTILLGNQGGNDGFTYGTAIICLDLSSWVRSYGSASDPESTGRAHRILSHEFTHLMSKAWERLHPQDPSTPLRRALFEMYYEGLGNYYSLSGRWHEPSVGLTDRSVQALRELGPILVERLVRLKDATADQEGRLREGLSAGPFQKKWGALPVALWLKKEAGDDPAQLRRWVQAGPCGVLALARKHLPVHLGDRLSTLESDCPPLLQQ